MTKTSITRVQFRTIQSLEIKSLVTSSEEAFAYYNPDSPDNILKALDDLDKYIENEGPSTGFWVSLKTPCWLHPSAFANISKTQASLKRKLNYVTTEQGGDPIHVPITIIWGQEDPYLRNFDALILALCQSPNVVGYMHSGGHEVLSSTSMEVLAETVKMIKRTIDMARKQDLILG
ncbi:hypothetical protein EMCG_01094 [[Emmonsia] crescens]|uniref:Serine hydrolase FSH domain-containing protein n=1 Tax=[Emmonsia] crescens TaxID=73230 RepID=A0A0G2IAR7_9EURO|nr:hypothetical protein EMCG_01094 [Emmonsia crescens UAMH 3008]